MDTISGIPSHPLFVHIPAVLLPLAALGVVLMVIRPAWHQRYRWAVLGIGFLGTVGAILAASAGESLEETQLAAGETNTWESHAEAGENARLFALIFFVTLLAYVLVPWYRARRAERSATGASAAPKWLGVVLSVVVLAAATGSVITVFDAGHSGAKLVWTVGGDEGDGDGD